MLSSHWKRSVVYIFYRDTFSLVTSTESLIASHFLHLSSMKSHLQSYPCPLIMIFLNIGLYFRNYYFITDYYRNTSDIHSAYFFSFFSIREIYYGWCLHYLHSIGVSFVFLVVLLHLGRATSYASYFYNPNIWFMNYCLLRLTGNSIYGLCLPLGQISL